MTAPELNHRLTGDLSRPLVLYLHGFLGTLTDWNETSVRLGDRFAHLTVDLPGHGDTDPHLSIDSYSMPETAGLVVGLLDRLGIERCHLLGYSMGGRLGLYLLLNHSERFERAIIESASPGLQSESERKDRRQHDRTLAERVLNEEFSAFLAYWYAQPSFASLDRSGPRYEAMLDRRLKQSPEGLARSLELMGTGAQPSLWEQLPSLKVPTLFVAGSVDAKFSDLAERMASLCGSTRSAIIPNAGHVAHFEEPDRFCELAVNFLTE